MSSRNENQLNEIPKSLTDKKELSKTENITQLNKISNKSLDNNKKNSQIHPLDFYTLGKVHSPPKYSSFFSQNRAFRSASNDLITRNIFSLNSCIYDNLLKNKKQSILSQQNIKENNYLKPLDVYKTYQKYNLPSNVVNKETYNIEKEKIFVKSNVSSIKKGMNMTYSNFMNYKRQLLTENNPKNANKTMKDVINENNLQRMNTENNFKRNSKSNEIKNKYDFDSNNNFKDNEKNNDLNDNGINKPKIKYVNPIDYSKKDLKGNFLYFDKNNQQFLRHKNWWIPDK